MVVGQIKSDVRITEIDGIAVMEVAQAEAAVIFGCSADDSAFALNFGVGSDPQTSDDTAINEEVVVTSGLEFDQQRDIHVGGKEFRLGKVNALGKILFIDGGNAVFVFEGHILVEAEVVQFESESGHQADRVVSDQDKVNGIESNPD